MQPRISFTILGIYKLWALLERKLYLQDIRVDNGIDKFLCFVGYCWPSQSFQLSITEFTQLSQMLLHFRYVFLNIRKTLDIFTVVHYGFSVLYWLPTNIMLSQYFVPSIVRLDQIPTLLREFIPNLILNLPAKLITLSLHILTLPVLSYPLPSPPLHLPDKPIHLLRYERTQRLLLIEMQPEILLIVDMGGLAPPLLHWEFLYSAGFAFAGLSSLCLFGELGLALLFFGDAGFHDLSVAVVEDVVEQLPGGLHYPAVGLYGAQPVFLAGEGVPEDQGFVVVLQCACGGCEGLEGVFARGVGLGEGNSAYEWGQADFHYIQKEKKPQ